MESVESVLDDDKIEEVFGGAGHSKATRASRVTAAKLQKAQLEEATAQVEELRRQVSTLTDAGEDSYSSALAFSPARTRAAARRPPPSPGGNQEGIPAEGGDPVTEPEAEPDGVHSAVGVGSVGAGEVEEVRPEEADDAAVELDDVVEVAGAEDVEDVELAALEAEFKERKRELEAKRQAAAATAAAAAAAATEGGSAGEATAARIERLVQAHKVDLRKLAAAAQKINTLETEKDESVKVAAAAVKEAAELRDRLELAAKTHEGVLDNYRNAELGINKEVLLGEVPRLNDPWERPVRQQLEILLEKQGAVSQSRGGRNIVELLKGERSTVQAELPVAYPQVDRLGPKDYETVDLGLPLLYALNDVRQHFVAAGLPAACPGMLLLGEAYELLEHWVSHYLEIGQARIDDTARANAKGAAAHLAVTKAPAQIELEFERYLKELRPVSGIPQTVEEAAAQQEREDRMARTFEEKLHKERNKTLIARIIKSEQRKPFKQGGGAGGGEKGSEDKGKGDS